MNRPPGDPYAPPNAFAGVSTDFDGVPAPLPLRVDGAFGRAMETMRAFLFSPFDLGKWFSFGAIVWIAELGEGGAPFPSVPNLGGNSSHGSTSGFGDIPDWLSTHRSDVLEIALIAGAAILLIGLPLTFLFMWLSARGTMMSFRAVALNQTQLGEHWEVTRDAAWSYLGFRVILACISLPFWLGGLAWAGFGLLSVFEMKGPDVWDYVFAILPGFAVVVGQGLVLAPFRFLGRNVLAPFLLKFGGGLGKNWARTIAVAKTSLGGVFMFLLVRMLVSFAQGIVEVIAIYATCCIGALPVVHQALVAPFHAFERAYTLRVLESLGPAYKLIADAAPEPWSGAPPAPRG